MLFYSLRTLILYYTVIISLRIMGKKQIGQMQPSELVVAIMISDLASIPMADPDLPIISGIVPVVTLIILEIFMSYISLKNRWVRKLISGEPSVIIYDGHINEKLLKKLRFNINDLLEQLRINSIPNVSDVEVAMLETNGQISIIPKKDARTVTIRDLKIKDAVCEKLPCTIISDGELVENELKRSGKDKKWLERELKKHRVNNVSDVFLASYDINDGLFIQIKGEEDITQ